MIPFILFAELIFLIMISEIMVRRMPEKLRELALANEERADGTHSRRRHLAEVKARNRLRLDVYALLLIVFGVSSACLLAVHTLVLPLESILGVFTNFDPDPEQFKSNLKDEGLADSVPRDFARRNQIPIEDSHAIAKAAFEAWPMAIVIVLGAMLIGFAVMRHGYLSALQDYASGLRGRAQEYQFRDLGRIRQAFETSEEWQPRSVPEPGSES